jgi:hypothetical protein
MTARYLNEGGDPVMYLQLGFLSSVLPGGKQWLRLDLAKAGKVMGIDFSRLMGNGSQSPTESLALLRSTGTFAAVGTAIVGGARTTHYHGAIELDKVVAARGAPAEVVQQLRSLGAPNRYPVDVWIDGAGYVRRFETKYHVRVRGKAVSTLLRMDLSDYGTTVVVSAPPADQVFDATDLATESFSALDHVSRG